ncbi:hypothetical protein [Geothrix sp.]|jgi:hypothetical protein|uniref:hypothetical protein n=1 Tax=Geothrix sp. TaxID=1962974 RepID=UPI0025C33596|nr:hypothetical protein [Geothrix sp.]
MKAFLRSLGAVAAGLTLAFVLVLGVELFSSVVHPFPVPFDGDIPAHVRRYPGWVLGVVVFAWGATFLLATGVASRIGSRRTGTVVGGLLACALLFNLAMLPYAPWFKVAMILACPFACWAGLRLGQARVPADGA